MTDAWEVRMKYLEIGRKEGLDMKAICELTVQRSFARAAMDPLEIVYPGTIVKASDQELIRALEWMFWCRENVLVYVNELVRKFACKFFIFV